MKALKNKYEYKLFELYLRREKEKDLASKRTSKPAKFLTEGTQFNFVI